MSDKLWRAVYDRFHKPQTDPEKKKENVERYHAMVKMMVAIERQNLLQIAEDKNFLNRGVQEVPGRGAAQGVRCHRQGTPVTATTFP